MEIECEIASSGLFASLSLSAKGPWKKRKEKFKIG